VKAAPQPAVAVAVAPPVLLASRPAPEPAPSPAAVRDVLRHFPSGVTVVTIYTDGIDHGLTVSAFVSVSIDPPLVAVVIDRRHLGWELLQRDGAVFAVNLLGREQEELSDRFARSRDEDRFAAGSWARATTGAPLLTDAVAWLDCTVDSCTLAGDHVICVGSVRACRVVRPEAAPLVYWNRGYRALAGAAGAERPPPDSPMIRAGGHR